VRDTSIEMHNVVCVCVCQARDVEGRVTSPRAQEGVAKAGMQGGGIVVNAILMSRTARGGDGHGWGCMR
jgi:hypothetical protein